MSSLSRANDDSATLLRPASTLLTPPSDSSVQPPSAHYLIPALSHTMEYNVNNRPPANWLFSRHGIPAVFRSTFSHTLWWTAEQRQAIRDAFERWASATYHHPLHDCYGYVLPASIRAPPTVQRGHRQRHTLGYFVSRLHSTNSDAGVILYGVDVSTHPSTAAFRTGPAGLDLHRYDVLHQSGTCNLTVIAGMTKTWTRPHVDTGGDSVWQLLVEGEKLWILARPEKKDAMKAHFHDQRTVRWSQLETEDKDWLSDNRCLMLVQRAGDLLYIPSGWPHMVTHLTDTIAINANLLHRWDFVSAINSLDFSTLEEGDVAMYERAYRLAVAPVSVPGLSIEEAQAAWERKREEIAAGAAQKQKEAAEAETEQQAERKSKRRKGG